MQRFYFGLACVLLGISPLLAQWSGDPAINTPVCTAVNSQLYPSVVTDGAGGVITAWPDQRNSASAQNVYAQRIGPDGTMRWDVNGVAVAPVAAFQSYPVMVSDGHGGAIIAWDDTRNTSTKADVYVQHINSSGVLQWGATGSTVCSADQDQSNVQIIGDGAGGAIIVWDDTRAGSLTNPFLYAQRIDSSGVPLWAANGVQIGTVAATHWGLTLMSDGANGAILVWEEVHNGFGDIYAQRVSGTGAALWASDGVPICTADNWQVTPQLCTDDAGGAFITWADHRAPFTYNIYAQRINSSGSPQWTADGIPICTATGGQSGPLLVADSAGTAVIAWSDGRSTANNSDVYAQRVNRAGTTLWTADGLLICGAAGVQGVDCISSDNLGGVMLTWADNRVSGVGSPDIYGQRVTSSGAFQWSANGIPISTASGTQQGSRFVNYGSSGAIVVWEDHRYGDDNIDIYCGHVNANGTLTGVKENPSQTGIVPPTFSLDQNFPNPFNPSTTVRYGLPQRAHVTIIVYNTLGQQVAQLLNGDIDAGYHEIQFNATNLASGEYFYRIQAGSYVETRKLILVR